MFNICEVFMKENYQLKMEEIIHSIDSDRAPKLLLQACCAPCSSYVIELLSNYFQITILYYNPNIYPFFEYEKRLGEVRKLIKLLKGKNPINSMEVDYDSSSFDKYEKLIKGLENEKEGGTRCHKCYYLRMEKTAKLAKEYNYDFFTTTLSISPYKNAQVLNRIGEVLEEKYHVRYLYADFKKKEGYKRSIELSKQFNLYRQEYCGCKYSIPKKEETL